MHNALSGYPELIIVEDDPDDREIILDILTEFDCHLRTRLLDGGLELIAYLETLPDHTLLPKLIVLDCNMPRVTGDATLAMLKNHSRFCKIPVAAYSTLLSPNRQLALIRNGACSVKQKPVELVALRELLQDYCRQAGF